MRFWLHTYGCQMNVRDSEAVEALMLAAGHEKASSEDAADVVIVNSCTVRQKAEEKAVGKVGNLLAEGKIVGLMGCAVKRMGESVFERLPNLHFAVGPRRFGLIPHLVERVRKGERRVLETGDDEVPQGLDAHPDTARAGTSGVFQSYVTVLLGCDNHCSYCIVPDVRGPEYSRPAKEVLAEIRCLAARGVKEVCLLGQSVLRYGVRNRVWDDDAPNPFGFQESFPRLLAAINEIDGIERIRFTSAHPKGCTRELLRVYETCGKVCRHIHLPVQSGSDRILRDMGRRYTRDEYLAAVRSLRALDPEFAVTTDVIVGYPGETAADFDATRTLMDEADFDNAFIFKYSPRPGTRSAKMADDVPQDEKERRNHVLLDEQDARGLRRNRALVGSVREVLLEGVSKRNESRLVGRDAGNRLVVWDRPALDAPPLGSRVSVKIREAHAQVLIGET